MKPCIDCKKSIFNQATRCRSCNAKHRWKTNPPIETDLRIRFWNQVNKTSHCWIWTGNVNKYGYGRIGGRNILVHRFAYELKNGPIPKGKMICHDCRPLPDNRLCVRHIFLGTHKENMRDAAIKHRMDRKLTDDQVRYIKKTYVPGYGTQAKLGRKFHVSSTAIRMVVHGVTKKHI